MGTVVFLGVLGLVPEAGEYLSEFYWKARQAEAEEKREKSQRDKTARA